MLEVILWASQVKNLPAMQETWEMWVQSLSPEDPLEEEMATHSSILSWRIPWTEEPCGLQSMGSQRLRHDGAHVQDLQEGFMSVVSLLPGAKLGELL